MCGCFAGQFSRENRRDIYMQLPDVYCNLHSSLKLVNCIVFSRLHLLRRRGTHSKVASWQQPVYWSPDLRSWWQHWSRTRIFSTETGCRGIVPSSAASDAFVDESVQGRNLSDDHRAHHQRRIPHLVSEPKVKTQAKRQRSVWAGRVWASLGSSPRR